MHRKKCFALPHNLIELCFVGSRTTQNKQHTHTHTHLSTSHEYANFDKQIKLVLIAQNNIQIAQYGIYGYG